MVINARAIFCLFVFFCWNDFSHTKNQPYARYSLLQSISPPPKFTMISSVITVKEGVELKKKTKTKIGVGSIVKAEVGELENITREGRFRRMGKEVVVCV